MIHLFKTHYSLGKSLIQVNDKTKEEDIGKSEVPNLVDLCIKYNVNPCFLVEDSLSGFWQIYKSLQQASIPMVFGLRVTFVNDGKVEDNNGSHKNIIFIKNEKGYKSLIKISTAANIDFFYKEPRLDYNYLHSVWSDDLVLAVPFYDSFLYKNLFTLESAIPDFRGIKPTIFYEKHDKPHDKYLLKSCENYASDSSLELVETRSIYYEKRSDFLAWKARKVMANGGHGKENTIMNSNLNHCSSDTFCLNIS